MYLTDLINKIKQGQIARVTFRGERWYVILSSDGIRYCDLNGDNIGEIIQLTNKNVIAHYGIIV